MTNDVKDKSFDIEEALEKTEFTGLVLVHVVLELVGIRFALPILECDLQLSHQQQGIIGSMAFAGVIASSHLWGFLADTIGRKRILQPTLLFGYTITICSSISPNFVTLAILRFLSFGKINIFVIIIGGVVLFHVFIETVGISFALPILECDLNLTHSEQGVLGAVAFIGMILSSLFWGFLSDTTGRKRIMHPALILGFISTTCSSFAPNVLSFGIFRFLSGVLLSASSATIFAYLGEFHSKKYRDRAIMYGSLISAISAVFFPIIALVFINQEWEFYVPLLNITYKPWRSYFVACGFPGFLCGLSMFYLPESPKYLLAAGQPEEALKVLERIYRINNRNKDDFKITSLLPDADSPTKVRRPIKGQNLITFIMRSMWQQTVPLFMRQHIRKTFLSSFILYCIFVCAHGVYMWFPYILNNTMKYTEQYSEPKTLCEIVRFNLLGKHSSADYENQEVLVKPCITHLEISTYTHNIVLEIIYSSSTWLLMYAIGKFGRKNILFLWLTACGVSGVVAFSITQPMVAIYLFVLNLCSGVGIGVVNAVIVEIFPTKLRGMAVCISLMIGRIGSISGSNILGALIETHCELALYSQSVTLIFAGICVLFLPKVNSTTETKTPETENKKELELDNVS